jgi:hypothetical protein
MYETVGITDLAKRYGSPGKTISGFKTELTLKWGAEAPPRNVGWGPHARGVDRGIEGSWCGGWRLAGF